MEIGILDANRLNTVSSKPCLQGDSFDEKTGTWNAFSINDPDITGKLTTGKEYYSCQCPGDEGLKGMFNLDIECPKCHHKVKNLSATKASFGYIPLGEENYIINPICYMILKTFLGTDQDGAVKSKYPTSSVLERIISGPAKIDADGNPVIEKSIHNPYRGIGMLDFKRRFPVIMAHFYKRRIKSVVKSALDIERYNFLMDLYNRDALFINKLFVPPINIRPVMILKSEKVVKSHPISTELGNIAKLAQCVRKLNVIDSDITSPAKIKLLEDLQKCYNADKKVGQGQNEGGLVQIICANNISKKSGIIRNNVLATRNNYSCRAVIVPHDACLRKHIDEVTIPYPTFSILLANQIANYIIKDQRLNEKLFLNLKKQIEKTAYVHNPYIFDIMCHIIELAEEREGGITAILNRNPTNCHGSMQTVRVTEVHEKCSIYTTGVSNCILPGLNGDYDGDVLALFLILTINVWNWLKPVRSCNLIINSHGATFKYNRTTYQREMLSAAARFTTY